MVKKASKKVETPAVKKILLSVAAALGIMAANAALYAALVIGGTLPVESANAAAAAICAIGIFTGVRMVLHGAAGKKSVYAGSVCGSCVLLLLMGNLLFVDTPPVGIGRIALAAVIAGTAAWLLSGRRPRPASRSRR